MVKLYFKYSAMNAGKTLDLIKSNYSYVEKNLNTLVFTSDLDTRSDKNSVCSRANLSYDAIPVNDTFNIYEYVKAISNNKDISCVFVDEVQFLKKHHIIQISDIVDYLNIPVVCYGVRTDFMGNLFEGSQWILAWADVIEEVKTICWCNRKATFNIRHENDIKICDGEQILIGGNDLYTSVCRRHWKDGKIKNDKI